MCASRHDSTYLGESGGGGGNSTLGGPYGLTPVFGTGDFSNSSTPPHSKNLERRRGIEPRTPRLQLGRSPLAVAALGTPGVIRTPNRGFGIRSPHHRQPGRIGAPGWIRTCTVRLLRPLSLPVGLQAHGRLGRIRTDTGHGLSVLPLPSWATSLWCSGRDSNSQQCGPRPHASTSCATRTLVGSQGFEPWRSQRDTASTARRFRPTQPTAQTRIVKDLAEGRRLERLCPEGPWLSRPVGYQLPEPSGYKLQIGFRGKLQA